MDLNDTGGAASVDDLIGGGAAPAADPPAGGDPAPAGDPPAGGDVPDWYGALSAETADGETASNLDYVRAKGFKDLDGLVKAYRHAEKGLHESGRIKVPGEGATAQEIAEYRAAIGVPETPEGYARPEFKDAAGNPIELNSALTERIIAKAHELGVPKAMLDVLLHSEIEAQLAEHDAAVKELQAQAAAHVAKWGPEKDQGVAQVNAALKELGFTRQDVEHMRAIPSGPGKFLDAMRKIGSNFTEDTLIKGDRQTFGMTPEAAQAEMDTMKADPVKAAKISVPGSAERQRWDRLNEIAAQKAAVL